MPPEQNKNPSVQKRHRKTISLELKSKVLKLNERKITTTAIAQQLNLPRTTIYTIIKDKSKITAAIKNSVSMRATIIRKRGGLIAEMEKLLMSWIQDQTQQGAPPCLSVIQSKALSLYETLKQGKGEDVQSETFKASRGWFMRFKTRYALHNIKDQEETVSTEKVAARDFSQTLWEIVQEEELLPKQVFSVTETRFFWKQMPSGTCVSQEEESVPGFKASKERVTLLLGSNAEGDLKLKPLLVNRFENPRALRNYAKGTLPVIWKSDPKALITETVFEVWLNESFIPEVKSYCTQNNLPRKALLLLDNTANHPPRISKIDPQIKVVFLPPDARSLLQGMDQAVMASFKAYYIRRTFSQALEAHKQRGEDLKTFWGNYNILDGLKNIASSWKEVKPNDLKRAWKEVCPQFVSEDTELTISESVNEITPDIVKIANNLPDIKVENEDIEVLLASYSPELLEEDLIKFEDQKSLDPLELSLSNESPPVELTSGKLMEAFVHLHAAMDIFEKNDFNLERSWEVNNNIFAAYKCYREMYENKEKEAK